ncbi:MAG: tRNA 2-thiocytidine biosynthesis protein TtcA, partial [Candidatus Desulforudis sp.]|nr:tRNA 2-thiocytidine biosynthesis protein TtcA [Desulforudis sp.]
MKCKVCRGAAIVQFPAHNANFCAEHLDQFFVRQIEKTIRRHRMLAPRENVLVAVSGGKDSLVVADVLTRLGYEVRGLHVDLGIEDNGFSDQSLDICRRFFTDRGLLLEVFSLKSEFGKGIKDAGRRFDRFCSVCGMTKRHLMNARAVEQGVDALATGHHLDDLSAALFANLLRWDLRYLAKGVPCLPPDDGFCRKIKPLALVSEKETAAYAAMRGIEVVTATCPFSREAKFKHYKELLSAVEQKSPGSKRAFYEGYVQTAALFQGRD